MSSSSSTTNKVFITCAKGFERQLSDELKDLGVQGIERASAGVYADGTFDTIYRANYGSRVASRVLLPLKSFRCRDAKELYAQAQTLDWVRYLRPDMTFAIDAHAVKNPAFTNSLYAAQVLKDALCDQLRDRFGERPSVNTKTPDVRLNLYVFGETARLGIDTSGAPLHMRGYRVAKGPAPMRETLAAGLLMLADYNDEPMIDPCCGSGTLLIEAAWMKQKRPPGCLREHWGFQGLPGFKREEWEAVKAELDARHVPDVKLGFLGIDCDKRMIESAKENLKAAGLERGISLIKSEFLDAPVRAESTFLMTNPPYGRRLGEEKELEPLYAEIGDFIKHKVAKPGRAYVYTGSLHLAKRVGLRTKRRLKVDNGGAEGRLLEFEVFE